MTKPPLINTVVRIALAFAVWSGLLFASSQAVAVVPTLTSIAPVTGSRLQTLTVTFTGTGFSAVVSSVNVGAGIAVNSTNVVSATQIDANITISNAAATGARNFSVTNSGGGGGTSATRVFTVINPAPTLASIAPVSGNVARGVATVVPVTFTGTGFNAASTVNIAGAAGVSIAGLAANAAGTTLTGNVTIAAASATGVRTFSVTNPAVLGLGGGTSATVNFTVTNPLPTLASVAPVSGNVLKAAANNVVITLTGTGFNTATTLNIAGPSGLTTGALALNAAGTTITTTVTIPAGTPTGVNTFSVTNPAVGGLGGGTSATVNFTVTNPLPTLASIAPNTGVRFQGVANVVAVTLTGTNFNAASTVNIAGAAGVSIGPLTVNAGGTQITANVTIAAAAATGVRTFSVTNPAPGGGTSATVNFTVTNPVPTLASTAPVSGDRLQGVANVVAVTLTGTNFNAASTVNVAGAVGVSIAGLAVNAAGTQITGNVTIAAGAASGMRTFSVTNAAPGGGTTATVNFTVTNPAPTLASIAPVNGTMAQGAATVVPVTLTGTGFNAATTVIIAGGAGVSIAGLVVNATGTTITGNVTIAAATVAGVRTFSVTNPAVGGLGGGTSATVNFTVLNPVPTLVSIAPVSGNVANGAATVVAVTLTGTNFNAASTVSISGVGVSIGALAVNAAGTTLTGNVTIAAGTATGVRTFSVTNAAVGGLGGGTSGTVNFTVNNPAPTLASIAPNIGVVAEGAATVVAVTLTGTGFNSASTVNIGGAAGVSIGALAVNAAGTQITANVTIAAAAARGVRTFSVTNPAPGGGTSANVNFTVNNPVPTLASIAPVSGDRFQGAPNVVAVTLTGTGFNASSTVNIAGGAGLSIAGLAVGGGGTTLTGNVTIAAGTATGVRTFSVTNPAAGGGTSATVNFTVTNPLPTLTTIAPTFGASQQGAATVVAVTLTGTGFSAASTVSIGAAGGVTIGALAVNAGGTTLTGNVTIPAGTATGIRTFSVTNPAVGGLGGGTTGTVDFTVTHPIPTLASIAPASGAALEGAANVVAITLTGTGFKTGISTVNIGGAAGVSIGALVVNAAGTQITANLTIAAGTAPGVRTFSVTNPAVNALGGGTTATVNFTVTNPAPTLASIAPTNGASTPGAANVVAVTLTGTGFRTGISTVNIGGAAGVTIGALVVNAAGTQITSNVTIAAGAANGARTFSVTNAAVGGLGGGTSANVNFTVTNPAPTLASIAPVSGNRFQGVANIVAVTLTGTGFNAASTVNIVGAAGVSIAGLAANAAGTTLTGNVTIAAGAATGVRTFSVTNPAVGGFGGGTSATVNFTVTNPVPTLTTIAPTFGASQQGAATVVAVTLTGTGFSAASTVTIGAAGGVTIGVLAVNAAGTTLTGNVTIPAGTATGVRTFSVTNPAVGGLGGGTTGTVNFTVTHPVPTLASIAPASGAQLPASANVVAVTLTGTGFRTGISTVNIGGAAGVTIGALVVNAAGTQITSNVTIAAGSATGVRTFSVTNPAVGGLGGGTTATVNFTVTNPLPTLASVAPNNATMSPTAPVVVGITLTGTNFSAASSVNIGGAAGLSIGPIAINGAGTQITTTLTIAANTTAGVRTFSVTNAGPGGGTSANVNFTVNNPAPTLASIVPSSGNRAPGAPVVIPITLTGTNFLSTSTVTVSAGAVGVSFSAVTVVNSTTITANLTIASGAVTGARTIRVTNPAPVGGFAQLNFTVTNPAPTLTSIFPNCGRQNTVVATTLTGTNFFPAGVGATTAAITGANVAIGALTVNGAGTQITTNFTIAAAAALTARTVTVTNPPSGGLGGGTSAGQTFTVVNAAGATSTTTSILPTSAGAGDAAFTLRINGTNFINGGTVARFNGSNRATTWVSATQLDVAILVTDLTTAGTYPVDVITCGGAASNVQNFTVGNPTITALTPNNAVLNGPAFTMDVSGAFFNTTSTVRFNGSNRTTTYVSASLIRANILASDLTVLGTYNVDVVNSGGVGAVSNTLPFTVAPDVGGFNAFETSTAAGSITGVIKTKIAGSALAFDVVALNTAKTAVVASFTGTVTVELVNSSSGACGTYAPIQSQSVSFTSPRQTVTFTENNAWANVRARMTYVPSSGPTIVDCSTDNFAIRPASLNVSISDTDWASAGTTRALTNTAASGGVVHKAGQPFTITVTPNPASATQYDGSPGIASLACALPAGCANGTLTPGAFAGTGTRISSTATYNEAGTFNLTLEDQNFANVDAADSTTAERYVPQLAAPLAVGRFVPDNFLLATSGAAPQFKTFNDATCGTRSFTYIGQPFGYTTVPTTLITARDASGATTTNYRGALWKLAATAPATTTCAGTTCSAVLSNVTLLYTTNTAGTNWDGAAAKTVFTSGTVISGNGTGTVSPGATDTLAYLRSTTTPVAPFNANISLNVQVADNSENGVVGNGIIATAGGGATFNGTGAGMAFDSGNEFRYGQLKIYPAYGSQQLALPLTLETQYWVAASSSFILNSADSCTQLGAANVALGQYFAPLASGDTTPTLAGRFANGRNTVRLSAPTGNKTGGAYVSVNLGTTTTGNYCAAVTGAAASTGSTMDYLRGKWCGGSYDKDPTANARFGIQNNPNEFIYQRENF
ncbi:MAG: hypothetical protein K8S22_16995 [Betaproteobacteria bacterium]|nr:hypothetical protein [Betaproteobacteria bacterium]